MRRSEGTPHTEHPGKSSTNFPQQSTPQDTNSDDSVIKESEPTAEDKELAKELNPVGQVFCFLPLPKEERSASGLPVHVNGSFAVSQNRRHLKWPSVGQTVDGDPALLWNRCLLQEVLPLSYVDLILTATQCPDIVTPQKALAAVPNLVAVDEKWQVMLEPFFSRLFELLSVLHAPGWGRVEGGRGLCV